MEVVHRASTTSVRLDPTPSTYFCIEYKTLTSDIHDTKTGTPSIYTPLHGVETPIMHFVEIEYKWVYL